MDETNGTRDCTHKWRECTDVPSLLNNMSQKVFKPNDSRVSVIVTVVLAPQAALFGTNRGLTDTVGSKRAENQCQWH